MIISICILKLPILILFFHTIDNSTVFQSMYSSALNASSQTYARSGCGESNSYYEVIQVKVIETGCYSLSINSTIKTYADVYKYNFDPLNPSQNLLSQNHNNLNDSQFKFITCLYVNTTYVLVVIMDYPDVKGAFSIVVSGPNHVNFNRISEYLYLFWIISTKSQNTEYVCKLNSHSQSTKTPRASTM
jgi:hypothetical protein